MSEACNKASSYQKVMVIFISTLREIGEEYATEAEVIRSRIRELKEELSALSGKKRRTETEDKQAYALTQRIAVLEPLLREARELAKIAAHYYD